MRSSGTPPVAAPIDHDWKSQKLRLMTPRRLWVVAHICAGLAALSVQHSSVAAPFDYSPDSLDSQCQGQGRTPDARIEACDRIIASGGGTQLSAAEALNLRGNHLSTKHEYDRAIEDYNRSIQLDPRHTTAFFNRGLAYVAIGDADQAMRDFDEQIRLQRRYISAFYQRGMIWAQRQKFDLAIGDFDEVIRLYHSFGDEVCCRGTLRMALYRRGRARLGMRDYDRAIDDFSQAIAIAPPFADLHESRGEAHLLKGNYVRAFIDKAIAVVLRRRGNEFKER
jgi:tetratricopeptide (TPR) repeat protein